MNTLNTKSYDAVLNETNDFFRSQGVNILGRGYEEIATNPALFEAYVDQLTEGCSADSAADMAQLISNGNSAMLTESSLTGITPVASLSGPVIRKLWPKFALKEAIANEVAKTPRFVVTYTAPYMQKGDGEKIYLTRGVLPTSANGMLGDYPAGMSKEYTGAHEVTLTAGAATVIDFRYVNGASGTEDSHVVISNTPSGAKLQPLDELVIVSAEVPAVIGTGTASQPQTPAVEVKIGKRLGVYGSQVYTFGDGQLLVQFDGANRRATFAAIGTDAKVVVKAGVSSEYNEESWDVGFDIKRQDVDIPTGQHLNAPLPVEALQDMQALYQIDGTKETVDLMTNIFAQKLDLDILYFLRDKLANRPSNEAFNDATNYGTYGTVDNFVLSFDCKPAAGYAHSPKEWREELKPLIDHLAQRIKNETFLSTGVFNIIGNPIDVMLLSNVDWNFRGGQAGGVDGVSVDYSIGTFVGANTYKVISSTNVPAGCMYVVFLPSGNTQMTYKYYAYSFNTELGYVDPNRSRVPSIMMTKRHTFYEFMPAIGAIQILNNDGVSYFRTVQDVDSSWTH